MKNPETLTTTIWFQVDCWEWWPRVTIATSPYGKRYTVEWLFLEIELDLLDRAVLNAYSEAEHKKLDEADV